MSTTSGRTPRIPSTIRSTARQWAAPSCAATPSVGIVLGGSGQGEQISANKVRGVRAALCNDLYTARMAAAHNNANVLSIGARIVAAELADEITHIFLSTPFDGGRHQRRLDEITAIETRADRGGRSMTITLGTHRPGDRRHHPARARAAEHHDPAHRVGELHVTRRARGAGLGAHQQVLRGLPGEALLRRQLRRRRSREPRARPRVRAVRCRARQRAAALGCEREPGRVHGVARAGRQGHGHAPRPGRPPHARFAGQLQRPDVRLRRVRRRRTERDARLRRDPRPGRARAARS